MSRPIVFLTEAAAAVQRARAEAKLLMVFLHGDFDGDVSWAVWRGHAQCLCEREWSGAHARIHGTLAGLTLSPDLYSHDTTR